MAISLRYYRGFRLLRKLSRLSRSEQLLSQVDNSPEMLDAFLYLLPDAATGAIQGRNERSVLQT